jgi:hypothetical protein
MDALRARIGAALREARWPGIDRIVLKAGQDFTGLTGKALKRTMRDAYRTPAAAG